MAWLDMENPNETDGGREFADAETWIDLQVGQRNFRPNTTFKLTAPLHADSIDQLEALKGDPADERARPQLGSDQKI
jgi:hypothetical protein